MEGVATYSEELLVGYRWYQDRGVEPAFPFGHGLGYTSFEFDDLRTEVSIAGIGLTFTVRNVGRRRGKAVPQVYVTCPPDAGEPPVHLRAFDAKRLESGEVRDVSIDIPFDDLAIFDDESQSRVVLAGRYEIQIGVSSLDHRLRATVQIGAR